MGNSISRGSLLHVGCGSGLLPDWLNYDETRADIDPECHPDVVANMTDLGEIGSFDVVYSSHCLEHVYPHEVNKALSEFKRVLNDGGFVMVFVPDLEDIKANEDFLYESPAGPITGMDLIYGHRRQIEENNYMQHKTGFTKDTLTKALLSAGFEKVRVLRLEPYNLMGIGVK